MKRKSKTSVKSNESANIIADLIPETTTIKKTNGKNGKHASAKIKNGMPTSVSANGANHNDLDTHELLRVLSEVRNGNFSVRMPVDKIAITGKI
jgi:hypothetical protein